MAAFNPLGHTFPSKNLVTKGRVGFSRTLRQLHLPSQTHLQCNSIPAEKKLCQQNFAAKLPRHIHTSSSTKIGTSGNAQGTKFCWIADNENKAGQKSDPLSQGASCPCWIGPLTCKRQSGLSTMYDSCLSPLALWSGS